MNSKIPRREFFCISAKVAVVAIAAPTVIFTTACGPALLIRAAVPRLSGVAWGALRTRPALGVASSRVAAGRSASALRARRPNLTVKALIEAGEWYLTPDISDAVLRRIEVERPQLIVEDESGERFNTPYGIYEDIGTIQSCYRNEPLILFEEPSFYSRRIDRLSVGQEVGVFNLEHMGGWYQVQTTRRDTGWVHGNCLEELPPAKYYY